MAIRITKVKPENLPVNKLEAHLAMQSFVWLNEQTQQAGEATRESMYDWIENKNGKAYIKDLTTGDNIYIFGAATPTGQHYIRTAENKEWTDRLIDLGKQSATPQEFNDK
jgi:hypothetical protein